MYLGQRLVSLDKSEEKKDSASNIDPMDDPDLKKKVVKLKSRVRVMELEQSKTLEEMRTMRINMENLISEHKTLKVFKDLSEGKTFKCDKDDFTTASRSNIKFILTLNTLRKKQFSNVTLVASQPIVKQVL